MAHTYIGLFNDSKQAGDAVSELKNLGYTKDISIVAKDHHDTDTHQIKQDVGDGAAAGAATGAALGALTGLLAGVASFIVPGIGFVVLGPLASTLTGAAAGALTGGIVGTLVDMGIPDEQAKDFQSRVERGQVLVAVTADSAKGTQVMEVFKRHGADETTEGHK